MTVEVPSIPPAVLVLLARSSIIGKSGSLTGSRGYRYSMPVVPYWMLVLIRMMSRS